MKNKSEKTVNFILAMILGIIGPMYFPFILNLEEGSIAYSYSFIALFMSLVSIVSIYHILTIVNKKDKRSAFCAVLFSVILTIALVFGKQLDQVENVNFKYGNMWMAILVLALYFAPFVGYAFSILEGFCKNRQLCQKCHPLDSNLVEKKEMNLENPFLIWVGLFLCWMPVFLAFYPGAFVYDAQDEYVQVATRIFTTHHPLVHVLLLGGSLVFANKFFDSYNIGIAMYTISQMIVLSGCFTYLMCFLKKYQLPKIFRLLTFLFLGFFPMIPMYAVCSAKDTLFTAATVMVVILLLEFLLEREGFLKNRWKQAGFVVTSITMMLFRNNGMYAYVVFMVCLMVTCIFLTKRKNINRNWKKGIFLMAVSVIGYFVISSALTWVLHADDSGKQEILTVPIQQLARTYEYAPEEFSEEQKETLYEILSEEALNTYEPNISDIIKSQFDNETYSKEPLKYQKLWLEVGMKKPLVYMNAWLLTSYGYWYPDTVINVYGGIQRFTFQYEDSSFFGFETELPGTRESKLPWLEEIYRQISLEIYQQKLPVVSMLFSPGFLFLLYTFFAIYFIKVKEWLKITPLLFIFLLWGTVILGPTYLVRYVLILWFGLPVLLALPLIHASQSYPNDRK